MDIHVVTIWEGPDIRAVWAFADHDDAQAYRAAAEKNGKTAVYDEQIVISHEDAKRYIDDGAGA